MAFLLLLPPKGLIALRFLQPNLQSFILHFFGVRSGRDHSTSLKELDEISLPAVHFFPRCPSEVSVVMQIGDEKRSGLPGPPRNQVFSPLTVVVEKARIPLYSREKERRE